MAPSFVMVFPAGSFSVLQRLRAAVSPAWAWLLFTLLVAGCAAFAPRSIEISEAQLQQRLDERFPVSREVLRVFDVTLGAPRLALRPAENRIATAFDLSIGERWLPAPWRGTLALSYRLRYEPRDATVRLADVRVDELRFDAASRPVQRELDRVGVLLAEQFLDDSVIHRFSAAEVDEARRRGLEPGAIRVGRRGVSIELQRITPR